LVSEKSIIPYTLKMALVLLWFEGFISISEVTLRNGNGCIYNEDPTAVS